MKKLLLGILCAALCGATMFAAACGGKSDKLTVYAPDGAPALALASLLAGDEAEGKFDVHIENANSIGQYVTGGSPAADFCILPVSAAAKLLGTGETYKMLGTVTQGNLYFLKTASKELPDLTAENVGEALLGKTVGVIQYENVPGLTLRAMFADREIPYATVETAKSPAAADKVNLYPCDATQVMPATGCDYYLCPEPARTTKIGVTNGLLAAAGSLQELYGDGEGYPQAVLVAKNSVLSENREAADAVVAYMKSDGEYLGTAEAEKLGALLDSARAAGMDAAFSVGQLNPTVLANCSVRYVAAADCKEAVKTLLAGYIAVDAESTKLPADAFFYAG